MVLNHGVVYATLALLGPDAIHLSQGGKSISAQNLVGLN